MATTLGSTGITFPDSTTQTTAITANPLTTNVRQAVTSSSTTTLNLANGSVIDLTMAANITTLSFTNVAASGTAQLVHIVVKGASNGTAYTITWPSSFSWGGTDLGAVIDGPTLASGANAVTVIALLTTDGGTKWRAWVEANILGGEAGTLFLWASNQNGIIGDSTQTARSSPVQIGGTFIWSKISLASNHTMGIKTDGTLWAWGSNQYGRLGLGNTTSYSSPKQVGLGTSWANINAQDFGSAGWNHAVRTNGTLWFWGKGIYGLPGLGNYSNEYNSPRQVGSSTNWSTSLRGIAHSRRTTHVLKADGTLWGWGQGAYGTIGRGTETNYSSPVQVGTDTNWRSLASGFASRTLHMTKTDGTLWFTGHNQQGIGTYFTNKSSPVQIGALTTWSTQISQSFYNIMGITTDGKLWSWGRGQQGVLGLNSTSDASSPTQMGSTTDWTSCAVHQTLGMATRGNNGVGSGGGLWVWGKTYGGQLGGASYIARSSPVQLGAFTNWLVWPNNSSGGYGRAGAFRFAQSNPA